MAKTTIQFDEVKKPVKSVTLVLTLEEAAALTNLTGSVGGRNAEREATSRIYNSLSAIPEVHEARRHIRYPDHATEFGDETYSQRYDT